MATQHNFRIKNGLEVAGTERITAAGAGSLTDLTLSGNLTVNGTTVTLDASTLQVADKNIVLNYHASNDTSSAANGAGITIQDAVDGSNNATILWDATNDEFDFSHNISSPGLLNGASNSFIYLAGGNASNGGSNILLYGQSHSSDANTTAFRAGGTETMRITSSGLVGIGTISPTSFLSNATALEISGGTGVGSELILTNNSSMSANEVVGSLIFKNTDASGSPNHFAGLRAKAEATYGRMYLEFYAGRSRMEGNTPDMVISPGGADAQAKVGIGETNPNSPLHVKTTDQSIQIRNTGNANVGLEIYRDSDGAKGASIAWGNGNANLEIKNYRNDGQSGGPYANIDFFTGGTDADSPDFNPTRRMRIQQTGEVGIGTDDPTKSLSVKAPSGSNGGIDVFHSNGNKVAELVHHGSGDEGRLSLYDGGANTIQLHGETGQNSYINSGNVGIGYASPGQKLQIAEATNYAPPGLGSNGGHFGIFKIDSGIPKYGILTGVASSGKVWQQVQRIDGTATAYNLMLQPSGGNIEIGTSTNVGFAGQTAPNTPIHVGTSTSTGPRIQISHENIGGFGSLDIDAYGSATLRLISNFSGSTMNGVATGKFGLVTPHGRDIVFGTSGVERFRISAGKTGIAFNSDTAQANHLDDYEEGEVSYYGGGAPRWYGSAGAFENTGQLGGNKIFYTKIGNMVHLHGQVSWTNTGSHGGQIRVNLPFPVVSGYRGGLALGLVAGLTMGGDALTLVPETGSTVAYLIEISSGVGHTHTDASDFTATSYRVVSFAGSYTTSS